jgi:hypothetical protein
MRLLVESATALLGIGLGVLIGRALIEAILAATFGPPHRAPTPSRGPDHLA